MSDTNNEREQQLFDSWFWKRYGRKPDMHGNDGDCGRWSAWLGRAHLKQEPALLLQDENSGREGRRYNEWHASRPDARMNAREAAAALTPHPETPAPLRGEVEAKAADFDEVRRSCVLRDVATTIGALMDTMDGVLARHLAAPMPQSAGVTDSAMLALRAIAEYPATDSLMNMDAANMRRIAQDALALAPGLSGWVSVAERMPDTDAEVLVWTAQGAMLDRWRMQSEAPLSFSSATIETGMYWDNHEFEEITHWQPITAPGLAPHQPQPEPTSKGEGWPFAGTHKNEVTGFASQQREPQEAAERPANFTELWELYSRVGDAHENHGRNHEKTMEARATFHAALMRALSAPQEAIKVAPVAHIDSAKIEALKDTAYVDAVLSTRALPFTVPVYLRPTQQALGEDAAGEFADWLCREMPPGTVISDPAWWAPKIMRAILAAAGGGEK